MSGIVADKKKASKKEGITRTALAVLDSLSDSYNFDVLRDLRRRACVQVATSTGADTDAMLSFVLGASSCGASLECLLESEHFSSSFSVGQHKDSEVTTATSSARGPHSLLPSVSHLVRRACTGDASALSHIETTLKTALTNMAQSTSQSATSSPVAAVCFATLERTSGKLLLGRYDGTCSSVVVLPLFAEINQVLDDLEAALASSKASLLRTMDAEAVGRWSDDEKRDWWNERKDGDKAVKTLLKSLEASLGAWKYLLCADVTDVDVLTDLPDSIMCKPRPPPSRPWQDGFPCYSRECTMVKTPLTVLSPSLPNLMAVTLTLD